MFALTRSCRSLVPHIQVWVQKERAWNHQLMSQELSSFRQRETEERSRRSRKDLEQTGERYKKCGCVKYVYTITYNLTKSVYYLSVSYWIGTERFVLFSTPFSNFLSFVTSVNRVPSASLIYFLLLGRGFYPYLLPGSAAIIIGGPLDRSGSYFTVTVVAMEWYGMEGRISRKRYHGVSPGASWTAAPAAFFFWRPTR